MAQIFFWCVTYIFTILLTRAKNYRLYFVNNVYTQAGMMNAVRRCTPLQVFSAANRAGLINDAFNLAR